MVTLWLFFTFYLFHILTFFTLWLFYFVTFSHCNFSQCTFFTFWLFYIFTIFYISTFFIPLLLSHCGMAVCPAAIFFHTHPIFNHVSRFTFGYSSVEVTFARASQRFLESLVNHPNAIVRFCSTITWFYWLIECSRLVFGCRICWWNKYYYYIIFYHFFYT